MTIYQTNKLLLYGTTSLSIGGLILVALGVLAASFAEEPGWLPVGCVALGGAMLYAAAQTPMWVSLAIWRSYSAAPHGQKRSSRDAHRHRGAAGVGPRDSLGKAHLATTPEGTGSHVVKAASSAPQSAMPTEGPQ